MKDLQLISKLIFWLIIIFLVFLAALVMINISVDKISRWEKEWREQNKIFQEIPYKNKLKKLEEK